ncbi:hypothetical protein [Yoonia sp. MH D7]
MGWIPLSPDGIALCHTCGVESRSEGEDIHGATRHGRQDVFPSPDDADPVSADVGSEGQYAPWLYVRNADNPVEEEKRFPSDEIVTFRAQVMRGLATYFPVHLQTLRL